MSAGLRDQRVRIYTGTDAGSDGWITSSYAFLAERWGRIETLSADESTVATQAEHQANLVVSFADEVTVPRDGVLKGPDGRIAKVLAVEPVRQLREIRVEAVWIDDEAPLLTGD